MGHFLPKVEDKLRKISSAQFLSIKKFISFDSGPFLSPMSPFVPKIKCFSSPICTFQGKPLVTHLFWGDQRKFFKIPPCQGHHHPAWWCQWLLTVVTLSSSLPSPTALENLGSLAQFPMFFEVFEDVFFITPHLSSALNFREIFGELESEYPHVQGKYACAPILF